MAPSPGLIAVSPTCRLGASFSDGMLSATALTAAAWACLLIVVTIRRPPRSMSLAVRPSLFASSFRILLVIYPLAPAVVFLSGTIGYSTSQVRNELANKLGLTASDI